MLLRAIYSLLFIFALAYQAEARVFKIQEERFAPYFRLHSGTSFINKSHFSGTSGTDVSISDSVTQNMGGEWGFAFTSARTAFRIGYELISPPRIASAKGLLNGAEVYSFQSGISALVPKMSLDIAFRVGAVERLFVSVGTGVATATYTNFYSNIDQGAFPGLADFTDQATATSTMVDYAICYEHLLSDTTTYVFELGYRNLRFTDFKYTSDVTNFSGGHSSGDIVTNSDGIQKSVDMSGAFVGISFRFYMGK